MESVQECPPAFGALRAQVPLRGVKVALSEERKPQARAQRFLREDRIVAKRLETSSGRFGVETQAQET